MSIRKLKRSVAHAKMEKEGIRKINSKHDKYAKKNDKHDGSYFSKHWREYVFKEVK